jgi:hypothetical protein
LVEIVDTLLGLIKCHIIAILPVNLVCQALDNPDERDHVKALIFGLVVTLTFKLGSNVLAALTQYKSEHSLAVCSKLVITLDVFINMSFPETLGRVTDICYHICRAWDREHFLIIYSPMNATYVGIRPTDVPSQLLYAGILIVRLVKVDVVECEALEAVTSSFKLGLLDSRGSCDGFEPARLSQLRTPHSPPS